jgi:hypothetical protein
MDRRLWLLLLWLLLLLELAELLLEASDAAIGVGSSAGLT